ncbi:DuF1740 family protein [Schizosaccharomyces cryophilus OY26]|uniref:DuF1740 family protein n=1 Tax=Schizosaccharomyces cryophilus (strain OY26 / ATCC MYA-4695 / CBS 11777 / NBRC 106824 / NRRL Y48691) TaxID=653667 RepID=S9VXF2_SCHCR|nr:DuF1740 family protein [Schizosaccharomyces cryophilus OY26]EPY50680.1 DuF1740 family protein [Schizosaccharomyces cryophilus OY26]
MLPRKDVPVPKFGSFKPIKREKDKHREKRGRGYNEREINHSKYETTLPLTDREQQLYNVKYDTKGDRKVFFYGGIHKYSIPKYTRKSNVIIGSHPEKEIVHKRSQGIYLKDISRVPSTRVKERTVNASSSLNTFSNVKDYQPFPESFANVTDDESTLQPTSENVKVIQTEIVKVRRDLEKDGLNPTLWLRLCSLQKDLLLQEYARPNMSIREERSLQHSLRDIQISILEKAIFSIDFSSIDVEQLVLEYFKLGSLEWDSKTTQNHWERLLSRYGLSENLWILYINYLISNVHSFSVDSCLQIFSECLAIINNKVDELSKKDESLECEIQQLEKTAIYVLLRVCFFARDSGYFELAYAITQVNMEINYFLPSRLNNKDLDYIKLELSKFWDSDTPKFGEPGALGWSNSSSVSSTFNQGCDESQSPITIYDSFLQWTENEKRFQEQKAWREAKPARKLNGKDDPFRNVIFEDVKDFICRFFTPKALLDLKYCFLNIYGIPILPPGANNDHFFVSDPWFSSSLDIEISLVEHFEKDPKNVNYFVSSSKVLSPGFLDIYFPCSTDLPDYFLMVLKGFSEIEIRRLITVLHQIFIKVDDEYFAGLYITVLQKLCQLDFEEQEYEKFSSTIKEILKKYENSIFVWNCFAQTEFMNGKLSLCEKIYKTAYLMHSSKFTDLENVWLHKNWAMQKVFSNDENGFWNVLLHLFHADQSCMSTSDKTGLTEQATMLFEEEQDKKKVVNVSFIYLMLSFFTEMEPIHYTIEKCVLKLESLDVVTKEDLEYFFTVGLAIALHYAKDHKIFSVLKMRPILEKAVELFPNNIILWQIFSWFESKHQLQFRVKIKALELIQIYQEKAIYPSYVFIMEEAKMSLTRMKDALDRVFLIRGLDFILSFWKIYLHTAFSNSDSSEMDCILGIRKAISHCPFRKDLYMYIFTLLQTREVLDEAKVFYLMMIEKGFRIHNEVASTLLESTVMKHYLQLPQDSRVFLSDRHTND